MATPAAMVEVSLSSLVPTSPRGTHMRSATMEFGDDEEEDRMHSEISCGANCTAPKVLVGIVRVDTSDRGKTLYVLKLSLVDTDIEWMVKRRYSEFLELRDEVYQGFLRRNVNQCFGCRWFCNSLRDFGFPRKHLVSSRETEIIRHRKNRLDRFARLLAAHTFSAIPKCMRCKEVPFYRIRDFFTADAMLSGHVTHKKLLKQLAPERFAAISDPLKSKIEFRRGHGIFRVIQVEKPILVQWREIEKAERAKRLRRRYSSSSSIASQCESTVDQVDLEEEKAATPPLTEDKAAGGEIPTSTGEVVATENAVALQPLSLPKQNQTTPRGDVNASHWDPRELASPKRTAAKQA